MNKQEKKVLVEEIVDSLGGKENIDTAIHCVTRLRFTLLDESLIQKENFDKMKNILGFQKQNGQYQVIIGNEVSDVFEVVEEHLSHKDAEHATFNEKKVGKRNYLSGLLEVVSSIFTPILPAIVGAGMMKGIIVTLSAFNIISDTSDFYQLLDIISDAGFYFLPFLLASSSAKRFKVNNFLALSLAGILMYPTIINGSVDGGSLTLVGGVQIPFISYASSVIPIIAGVYFMSWVSWLATKVVPKVLNVILVPFITLLITAPVTLLVFGPIGNMIGFAVAGTMNAGFLQYPLIVGGLVGAVYPLMIVFGMHYATFPILFENLGTLGYDSGFFPIGFISNMSQSGISFAHALRTKDEGEKSIALTAGISALMGITEPSLFGITLKNKKYLSVSMVASGISSAFALYFGVKCFSFIIPGIASLPAYIETGTNNFLYMFIAITASFFISFVGALLTTKNNEKDAISNE